MSVENVKVKRVTKGQIRITAVMLCFSGHFGDFKTNPNGHEILQIIYRWKGMDVYCFQNFTKLNFNPFIKSYGHKTIQMLVLKNIEIIEIQFFEIRHFPPNNQTKSNTYPREE